MQTVFAQAITQIVTGYFNMKRLTAIILSLIICFAFFAGCSGVASDEKISIVCTIFPQYDWVRQIIGDNADNIELTLLLDDAIDLHNYQPSVDDIMKISNCDLFIYVGGESDEWVADALHEAVNEDMVVINLLEVLGNTAKEEELVEGMQPEEHEHSDEEEEHDEHEDEEHEDEEHEHEEEVVYDEHVWLSLRNAQLFCDAITKELSSLDAENADAYKNNMNAYIDELDALDAEYMQAVDAAFAETSSADTLLFGDRFPFRYMVDDYGIDYYAAFVGCSAETEASFDTIIFLAEKIEQLSLETILITESSDGAIAETIRDNTANKNQQILLIDAMQSISVADIENGTTYLSIMGSNLDTLKLALA